VRSSFRLAGLDVFRAAKEEFRWSHTADDFYPVTPMPRWGENSAIYRGLIKCLEPNRSEYGLFVSDLERSASLLHSVPFHADGGDALKPCWDNYWFTALDAAALMVLITQRRPNRFIEIGSGYSTKFANHAIQQAGLGTEIISIDPHPRDEIDRLCKRVVRSSLEKCDLTVFDQLEAGDMLFFDGSHRLFSNSDVLVFFLEVLPKIKPGVIVQVHDIFLPFDYPDAWNRRLYNEQYLLAGIILYGTERFRIIAPISYICYDAEFGGRVKRVFSSPTGGPDIPFFYPNPARNAGTSFWFQTS
jgi:hypothetical protein